MLSLITGSGNVTLEAIAKFCQGQMNRSARIYLKERGVSEQSTHTFGLGYCPFEIDEFVESLGRQQLLDQGVLFETEDGDLRCFIRNSITFPFINQYEKVVSISFRPKQSNEVIKTKKLRKYWHTSFPKGNFVYGLRQAIPFIRQERCVIVAEGQFDVIIAHQLDIKNTVSVGGTALSARHINLLSRFAKRIVVVFDGDEGGQKGLEKVREQKLEGTTIETIELPDGEDVDSFLQSYGKEAFLELINGTGPH